MSAQFSQKISNGLVNLFGMLAQEDTVPIKAKEDVFLIPGSKHLENLFRSPGIDYRITAGLDHQRRDFDSAQARLHIVHEPFDLAHSRNRIAEVIDVRIFG